MLHLVTLVLAEAALAWPLAFRQIYASLCAVPQSTLDAARMFLSVAPDTVFRIMIPSAKRREEIIMEARSVAKFIRLSPQKARLVARNVTGKPVEDALNILKFTPKK